jgi:phosphohistidine phosphatase
MNLLLIRHGNAETAGRNRSDTERALSAAGVREVRHVARVLARLGLRFSCLACSPLNRARQTAALLVAEGLAAGVDEVDALAPDGEVDGLLRWVAGQRASTDGLLGCVGHLPSLAEFVKTMVGGSAGGVLHLPTAGVIGLELPASGAVAGRTALAWLTSPALLR